MKDEPAQEKFSLRMATILYSFALLIAMVWMYLSGNFWLSWGCQGVSILACIAVGTATGLFVVLLGRVFIVFFSWARSLDDEFAMMVGPLSMKGIVCLALVSSMAEEAFFRGAMQAVLGIVITSIIFGILHFVPRTVFLPWTIMALGMGFVLGSLAYWSGGLAAGMICHFIINAIDLAFISAKARKNQGGELVDDDVLP